MDDTFRMSENPYQPSQVALVPATGFTQILAYAAWLNLFLKRWTIYAVSLQAYFFVFGGLAIFVASLIAYVNQLMGAWVFLGLFSPLYLLLAIAAVKHNIIFTATSFVESKLQRIDIRDTLQLNVSGKLMFDETHLSSGQVFLRRLMIGRRSLLWFVAVPCELHCSADQPELFALLSQQDPSRNFWGINLEKLGGTWSAAGKIDPDYIHQLGTLHRGTHNEFAARIGFIDQFQRRRWIIISSLDQDSITDAVAMIMLTAKKTKTLI